MSSTVRAVSDSAAVAAPVSGSLVSLAGLLDTPFRVVDGSVFGRVQDVIVWWDGRVTYPPVTAVLVKTGRSRVLVSVDAIEVMTDRTLCLSSSDTPLILPKRRRGDVALRHDVLDRQIVDADGRQVVRASDLYLAQLDADLCLVAVDVGIRSLLRRLGPSRFRRHPTPTKVLDWGGVQTFESVGGTSADRTAGAGETGSDIELAAGSAKLRGLNSAELAELLANLTRSRGAQVIAALDGPTALRTLGQLRQGQLSALLAELPTSTVISLLKSADAGAAARVLRRAAEGVRERLLGELPTDLAERLRYLLSFPAGRAAALMRTDLLLTSPAECVDAVRLAVANRGGNPSADAAVVVNAHGVAVADIPIEALLAARGDQLLHDLVTHVPDVAGVPAGATYADIITAFTATQRNSLLVIDEAGKPLGRLWARELLEASAPLAAAGLPWGA
jgi:MgtE intracellular N domain